MKDDALSARNLANAVGDGGGPRLAEVAHLLKSLAELITEWEETMQQEVVQQKEMKHEENEPKEQE